MSKTSQLCFLGLKWTVVGRKFMKVSWTTTLKCLECTKGAGKEIKWI